MVPFCPDRIERSNLHSRRRRFLHWRLLIRFGLSKSLTVLAHASGQAQRTLSLFLSSFYFQLTHSTVTLAPVQHHDLKSILQDLSTILYSNYIFRRRIRPAALRRSCHSDHPTAVVNCRRAHRLKQTFDVATVDIPQRECGVCNPLGAQPHLFVAVVAELENCTLTALPVRSLASRVSRASIWSTDPTIQSRTTFPLGTEDGDTEGVDILGR